MMNGLYLPARTGARGLAVLAVLLAPLSASARAAPDSFADLAARLTPAVVNISTTKQVGGGGLVQFVPELPPGSPFEDFFKRFMPAPDSGAPRTQTSLGSGFIIGADGYVVTNNHVIAEADEITVILQDETRLAATLVGRDPKTDLALLKVVTDTPLPFVGFGDSDAARVGDWVLAIGNPFGLGGTVTAGIISARSRNIQAGPFDDFLQTDASINRGNSGGPLFDMNGQVIGINTAIFSPTGGNIGIGFAIPAALAEPVLAQLREHGRPIRGWLGVQIQAVTDDIAAALELDEPAGALVAGVIEASPAAGAGLKVGDLIVGFGGRNVENAHDLPRFVAQTEVGKPTQVEVLRHGRALVLEVVIGELDEPALAAG